MLLYTGESSLALQELGITVFASEERLADDDIEFLIDKKDIVKVDNVYKIVSFDSAEFVNRQ